jgi:hypothetical protein
MALHVTLADGSMDTYDEESVSSEWASGPDGPWTEGTWDMAEWHEHRVEADGRLTVMPHMTRRFDGHHVGDSPWKEDVRSYAPGEWAAVRTD